ncbi:MAG: trypsin-like serine protease [Proteobacteria bacterium]|nr:trypsin-like serine protease [Pseudomonadota bacterium]
MRLFTVLFSLIFVTPAFAISGQAPPASGFAARPIVMLIDNRGDLCTATALTRDLVLTAAHCVIIPATYRVRVFQDSVMVDVDKIRRHPGFNMANYRASRATADVALVKLKSPLPNLVVPATLAPSRRVAVGEALTIAGFGVTQAGTAHGLGQPRMANLTVTGKPGSLQIRLEDPATRNERHGLGGCTGDSGAPAFDGAGPHDSGDVIGIVSWSTAPKSEEGCGGLTGLTPLLNYRDWIVATAAALGSPLAP